MSDSLGTLIHRLSGVYRDPQRVLRDAESLLSSPLGSHLRPTTEPLMLNDGSSTPPVLLLRGTIPMTYKGVTYNLPIDCYLPPPYPLRPPTVFVRPVIGMAIKENHRHVGLDGRVYLPYLHDWRPGTHDLRELAVWMSSLFGSEPPCYSKPAGASNPPPPPYASAASSSSAHHSPHHSHASTYTAYGSVSTAASSAVHASNSSKAQEDERRKAFEKEIDEANLAAEIARKAAIEESRAEAEQKRMQRQHAQELKTTRAMAMSKVHYEINNLFRGMKEELRLELKNQKQLEYGKEQIEKVVKEGNERKRQLEKNNEEMEEALEGLENWLTAVKEQQQSATASEKSNQVSGETKADFMALPADTHSAQMLALSAESAVIDDCIYFLDRALVRGSMSAETFLKEVRKLSKRQFMAKAHLIKIAQTRAAER